MNNKTEYILCAAIWVDDGFTDDDEHCPINGASGSYYYGYRHDTINGAFSHVRKAKEYGKKATMTQGFLTSHNRFVDRATAAQIAMDAEQVSPETVKRWKTVGVMKLLSEDLY